MLRKEPEVRPSAQAIQTTLKKIMEKSVTDDNKRHEIKSSDSKINLPERQTVIQALLRYFKNNIAVGIASGFAANLFVDSKLHVNQCVRSIRQQLDECDAEETLVTNGYGRSNCANNKQTSNNNTNNKSSLNPRDDSPSDRKCAVDVQVTNVIKCAHEKLQLSHLPNDDSTASTSPGKKGRKKKNNFLKVLSNKQLLNAKNQTSEKSSEDNDHVDSVTLYTRGQRVTFRKSISVQEEDDITIPPESAKLERMCEEDLGSELFRRACQLSKLITDDNLLQMQLKDLIGWRHYRKYGKFLTDLSRTPPAHAQYD